jgi:hypothetical protein
MCDHEKGVTCIQCPCGEATFCSEECLALDYERGVDGHMQHCKKNQETTQPDMSTLDLIVYLERIGPTLKKQDKAWILYAQLMQKLVQQLALEYVIEK